MTSTKIKFDVTGTGQFGSWEELLHIAQFVEKMGFNGFHAADHTMPVAGFDRFGPFMEPWTLLAGIAARTERIRLGTIVTGNTYRHPVMLAKMVTNVDLISRGRVDLGIGTGWSALDHQPFGIPYPPFAERVERLEEAVTLIRMLWTQKLSDYKGRHYQLDNAPFEPKPLQKPHPPFTIGGSSKGVIGIVARHADTWNGLGSLRFVERTMQRIDEACAAIGRDPKSIERSLWCDILLTADEAETNAALAQRSAARDAAAEDPRKKYGMPGETIADIVRTSSLIGTPEQVRRQVQAFAAIGITRFMLRNPRPYNEALMERFGKEVIAAFS